MFWKYGIHTVITCEHRASLPYCALMGLLRQLSTLSSSSLSWCSLWPCLLCVAVGCLLTCIPSRLRLTKGSEMEKLFACHLFLIARPCDLTEMVLTRRGDPLRPFDGGVRTIQRSSRLCAMIVVIACAVFIHYRPSISYTPCLHALRLTNVRFIVTIEILAYAYIYCLIHVNAPFSWLPASECGSQTYLNMPNIYTQHIGTAYA